MGLIFGILYNNYIWQYFNLVKFKVLLYNLKCSFRILIWCHRKNHQILILAKISAHTVHKTVTMHIADIIMPPIVKRCGHPKGHEVTVTGFPPEKGKIPQNYVNQGYNF